MDPTAEGAVRVRDGEGEDFRLEGDWNETAGLRHLGTGKLVRAEKKREVRAKKEKKGEGETFTFETPK